MDALIASQLVKFSKQRAKKSVKLGRKKGIKPKADKPKALASQAVKAQDDLDLQLDLLFNGPDPLAQAMQEADIDTAAVPDPVQPDKPEGKVYKLSKLKNLSHFNSSTHTDHIISSPLRSLSSRKAKARLDTIGGYIQLPFPSPPTSTR